MKYILIGCLLFTGCAINMSRLAPGMTEQQVINTLGKPDGFHQYGDDVTSMDYIHRHIPWSGDNGDYYVIFIRGKVDSYGTNTIRESQTNTSFIVPLDFTPPPQPMPPAPPLFQRH